MIGDNGSALPRRALYTVLTVLGLAIGVPLTLVGAVIWWIGLGLVAAGAWIRDTLPGRISHPRC